ncbi:hypothetical protein [Ureibacillus manganicus]|uniref:Uncharacterized protein n=1 Tax=Ureibacillus manganicus DSM 26584 TaxID=1384049 RepID=A0A0A3I3I7_9BACL|nr:hypothetical protein [Ureibacillus manganicus]KGR77243.1 hypothetical protein CD29_15365 [Ureibacillus manganicus DSM 26584]
MKDRYIWIAFFIVILSMFGNYLYFQSKQLEHPIFLEHYYETYAQEGYYLRFYYLSNKSEPVEVSHVLIDGVTVYPSNNHGHQMWSNQNYSPNYEQEFTHHYLQRVTFSLPEQESAQKFSTNDVWTFNEMQVTFTNGQTIDTNIGEVKVYHERTDTSSIVSRFNSRIKNDNDGYYTMFTKPLNIESITIPFGEKVSRDVLLRVKLNSNNTIKLDDTNAPSNLPLWYHEKFDIEVSDNEVVYILGENLYPFHIDTSDWFKLYIRYNPNNKNYYDFDVKINGTTDEGKSFEYRILTEDRAYLTQQDVNEILAEYQGGSSNEK